MEPEHGRGREESEATADESPPGPPGGPPRRSRRRGLLIGGAIAVALLFLTAGVISLVLIAAPGGSDGRPRGGGGGKAAPPVSFQEKYVSGEGSDKIAVLPVTGLISPEQPSPLTTQAVASPEILRDQLRQASEDQRVSAVILEIDSPGGGVVPTDEMHRSIEDFKEATGKPVVVSMGATAASGGYYISTAADRIVANESTLTGSLGVIFEYLNLAEAAEEYGIEQEVIKSGPYKDIGSSTREPTEEELEILQSYVDEGYDQFVQVIVEGRDLPEEEVREIAGELAGLEEEPTVIRYQRRAPGLGELLLSRLAPSEPEALKVLKEAGLNPTPELRYLYRP